MCLFSLTLGKNQQKIYGLYIIFSWKIMPGLGRCPDLGGSTVIKYTIINTPQFVCSYEKENVA